MLKLHLPELSKLEQSIRKIGASTLPSSSNFWFEDTKQIPATLFKHVFKVETDQVSKIHELWLNNRLYAKFTPSASLTTLSIALNPGVYDYALKHELGQTNGSFQISNKELLWWILEQELTGPYQDLQVLESRFNSTINLLLFEIIYPVEISSIENPPFSMRKYSQSSLIVGAEKSLLTLASALQGSTVKGYSVKFALTDSASVFSKITIPLVNSISTRKSSFVQQHLPEEILDSQLTFAAINKIELRTFDTILFDYNAKVIVENYQEPGYIYGDPFYPRAPHTDFTFSVVDVDGVVLDVLEYTREFHNLQTFESKFFAIPPNYRVFLRVERTGQAAINYRTHVTIPLIIAPNQILTETIYWDHNYTTARINAPSFANWKLIARDTTGPLAEILVKHGTGSMDINIEAEWNSGRHEFRVEPLPAFNYVAPRTIFHTFTSRETYTYFLNYRPGTTHYFAPGYINPGYIQ